jgi:hypothetical protein
LKNKNPTQAELVAKVATADSGGFFCTISNMWKVSKPLNGSDNLTAMQFATANLKTVAE